MQHILSYESLYFAINYGGYTLYIVFIIILDGFCYSIVASSF